MESKINDEDSSAEIPRTFEMTKMVQPVAQQPATNVKPNNKKKRSYGTPTQYVISLLAVAIEIYIMVKVLWESMELGAGNNPWSTVSFFYPAVGSLCYLIFVYGGSQFMKTREAFQVEGYMIVYNLFQAVFNLLCVIGFVYIIYTQNLPLAGREFDPTDEKGFYLGFLIYLHYQNKYVEFLDTAFMIIRKKEEQLSFLHVQHHSLMVFCWWIVLAYQPGGDSYFGALANSIIHTCMYSYYGMALLGIPCPWKKYVTQLQLLQFVVAFSHGVYVLYLGSTPAWLAWLQIAVMVDMLVLFGLFYVQTYSSHEKPKIE